MVTVFTLCVDALVDGFQNWMWRGLGFILPFLLVGYVS